MSDRTKPEPTKLTDKDADQGQIQDSDLGQVAGGLWDPPDWDPATATLNPTIAGISPIVKDLDQAALLKK